MNEPEFIKVNSGDIVIAEYNEIARDLSFVVGARDPNTLYFFNSQTLILKNLICSWWKNETNSVQKSIGSNNNV